MFDKKTELEQLTHMGIGNSKAGYNLAAQYADQIDTKAKKTGGCLTIAAAILGVDHSIVWE